jgi:uncharacterized protein
VTARVVRARLAFALALALLSGACATQKNADLRTSPRSLAAQASAPTRSLDAVWDVRSSESGRTYRISVALPDTAADAAGLGVIYVLDANLMFGTMADTVRAMSRRPGLQPAMVVGIGYPPGTDLMAARALDLTPTTDPSIPTATGGAAAFLRFVRNELQPDIAAKYPVRRARNALFGHSFGALFTLYALMEAPDTFDAYVAASPSIWFAERYLQQSSLRTSALERIAAVPMHPRVLITVGEYEQAADPDFARLPGYPSLAVLEQRGQIDNAREFAQFLRADAALEPRFELLANEDHGSVIPAAIARAVRFAMRPER